MLRSIPAPWIPTAATWEAVQEEARRWRSGVSPSGRVITSGEREAAQIAKLSAWLRLSFSQREEKRSVYRRHAQHPVWIRETAFGPDEEAQKELARRGTLGSFTDRRTAGAETGSSDAATRPPAEDAVDPILPDTPIASTRV